MDYIILFAILGAVFYYISQSYGKYTEYSKEAFKNFSVSKFELENSELGLFVALVAKVAKADGRVDSLEAELVGVMFDDISKIFPEPEKTKEILKEIFNEQKDRTDDVKEITDRVFQKIKNNKSKQHQFMGFLIQLAFVDGKVSEEENRVLIVIAETMEFDPKVYHAIFDSFEKNINKVNPTNNIEDSYKLLGVKPTDDMGVIKKAYRKLVKQYHPDIIKSQGKGESYIQEATIKTQEINQAYEMIKKDRK